MDRQQPEARLTTEATSSTATAHRPITVALSGNPNCGKTSIFNQLTGARHHVANYPGVTVELRLGRFRYGGHSIHVADLPGTYGLTAYSDDELVARRYLLERRPDVIVHVVDASNLERNLYLAIELIELGLPLVIALNMIDVAERHGLHVDAEALSQRLGVPVVPTVGCTGAGIDELKRAILSAVSAGGDGDSASASGSVRRRRPLPTYRGELERQIAALSERLAAELPPAQTRPTRWLAIKLIEGDELAGAELDGAGTGAAELIEAARAAAARIEQHYGEPAEAVIATQRYEFIAQLCRQTTRQLSRPRTVTERIDSVVTHRLLGFPIFVLVMYLVFKFTFALGEPAVGVIERAVAWLGDWVGSLPIWAGAEAVRSLVVDGAIAGVGNVLVFVPNIMLLFLAISLLEDTGYMARAAFIMDRVMQKVGLHGRSFIPMLLGFGCNVPAIMATRTLQSRRDRLATMLVLPLMSCSARLPIYTLLIPAFFPPGMQAPVLWGLYFTGVALAVVLAKLLRVTLLRGEQAPFVMELPPYRLPTLRSVFIEVLDRTSHFVRKAGTVILAASILLWAMASYPKPPAERLAGLDEQGRQAVRLAYSLTGRVGGLLEPIMRPIGLDWKASVAVLGGLAAKEVVIAQFGIVYAVSSDTAGLDSLRAALQRDYTPLQALCIMLFCLISMPCMATIAATWKESGSWRWAALQSIGLSVVAYVVTLAVYQGAMLLD